MSKYYVYAAYGVNDELLYIGKGSGSRLQHCVAGTSSSRELNRYFFQNGETGSIKVKILKRFETGEDALKFEMCSIVNLKPLFNKNFSNPESIKSNNLTDLEKLKLGICVDFSRLMKTYIEAIECGDKEVFDTISEYSEEHKMYVEVLGITKIKTIGFHKTKLAKSYHLKIKLNETKVIIKDNLKGVNVGSKYTLNEINLLLSSAYEKANYKGVVKSRDITNYYSVKSIWMTVDGKRAKGYLIISDLYKEDFY